MERIADNAKLTISADKDKSWCKDMVKTTDMGLVHRAICPFM